MIWILCVAQRPWIKSMVPARDCIGGGDNGHIKRFGLVEGS